VTDYDLLAIRSDDRRDLDELEVDPDAVAPVAAVLRERIGTFPSGRPEPEAPELVWIAAFLETLPDLLAYFRELGIPDDVVRDTLADFGQHLALNRIVRGGFGMETRWWLTNHWSGSLYQLGRLQFQLHRTEIPGVGVEAGDWVLGIHIPETGPLTPEAVDDSLRQAKAFFARYFPDKPVRAGTCVSWLLDPYLLDHLPPESNTARFGRRFALSGELTDQQGDAVYFVFRTRDLEHLDELPRDTALQRLVLDRIAAGGTWQVGRGTIAL
jgi:hypothetical protein